MSLPNRSTASQFGATGKVNDQLNPPAITTIDWDNPSLARAIADVAALGLASVRFWCRVTTNSTGTITLNNWWAQWANATTTAPTVSVFATGIFIISVPTQVNDEYDLSVGVSTPITVNLLAARASVEGATALFTGCSATGAVITLNTLNVSGSAETFSNTFFITAY
jgi:hypothetical protein